MTTRRAAILDAARGYVAAICAYDATYQAFCATPTTPLCIAVERARLARVVALAVLTTRAEGDAFLADAALQVAYREAAFDARLAGHER